MTFKESIHKFSPVGSASDDKAFPVFFNQRLGYLREPVEVCDMRFGYQMIQMYPSKLILSKNSTAAGSEFGYCGCTGGSLLINIRKSLHALGFKLFKHLDENTGGTLGIVHSSVVMTQVYAQSLCHGIESKLGMAGKLDS